MKNFFIEVFGIAFAAVYSLVIMWFTLATASTLFISMQWLVALFLGALLVWLFLKCDDKRMFFTEVMWCGFLFINMIIAIHAYIRGEYAGWGNYAVIHLFSYCLFALVQLAEERYEYRKKMVENSPQMLK